MSLINEASIHQEHIDKSKLKKQINGISTNIDNTLLSLATNCGYKIYSLLSFIQISTDDEMENESQEIKDAIGPLQIAIPYYQSSLLLLVGKCSTSAVKSNEIILWNDMSSTQLALIVFNSNIISAKMTKESIVAAFQTHIEIIDLITLEHVFKIEDITFSYDSSFISLGVDYKESIITIANIAQGNSRSFKVSKFKYNDIENCITGYNEFMIPTPFDSIYKISINKKGDMICVIARSDNRIHIYSSTNKKLLFCFEIDSMLIQIIHCEFDKSGKFISIFFFNNYVEIYQFEEEKTRCKCFADIHINGQIRRPQKGYCYWLYQKFALRNSMNCFARYKYPYKNIDELISVNLGQNRKCNKYLFYCEKKGEMCIVDYHGVCQKIKYNTKHKDMIWCYKEIKFLFNHNK